MKLSSLLLSTAALVVAGSAYAADLPAKKGAPAAKPATGCPAFGAGYFQIPGGDTCIKFSGWAAYEGSYSASAYTQTAEARLIVDTASNTDLGALKSRLRITGGKTGGNGTANADTTVSVSRAYGSIGGFKFGRDDSHADIAGVGAGGTYAWNGGSSMGSGTGVGMWYAMPVGGATVEIGEENAVTDGVGGKYSNRPDAMIKATIPAGPATFTAMGISHAPQDSSNSTIGSGYAFLANVSVQQGDFGAAVFGGVSQGAMKYTGSVSTYYDMTSNSYSKGSNVGAEVTAKLGAGTVALLAGQYALNDAATTGTTTTSYFDVEYDFSVAKNFTVKPEVYVTSGSTQATTYYLTVTRDF
jgi:hypothetical protein